jgi:hypothetical protein
MTARGVSWRASLDDALLAVDDNDEAVLIPLPTGVAS